MSSSAIRRNSPARRPDSSHSSWSRPSSLKVVREKARPQQKRSRLVMVGAAVVVLLALIVIPLLINTQLAVLSYQIHDDQVALAKLQESNQLLTNEINEQSSAERVRTLAEEQGLVPAGETGFIKLSEGKVEGGKPAVVPETNEADSEAAATSNANDGGQDAHTQEVNKSESDPSAGQ